MAQRLDALRMAAEEGATALRQGVRHIHEWYSSLSDQNREEVSGLSVTFHPDGVGMTVAIIDREREGPGAPPPGQVD